MYIHIYIYYYILNKYTKNIHVYVPLLPYDFPLAPHGAAQARPAAPERSTPLSKKTTFFLGHKSLKSPRIGWLRHVNTKQ